MEDKQKVMENINNRLGYNEEVLVTRDEVTVLNAAIPSRKITYKTFKEVADAIREGSRNVS